MIDIQGNLQAILKERGFLQKNVAKDLGITEQGLSNWFTRKTDMTFTQISRICEVCHIDIIDVVTYPVKYIPESSANPECEECKKKDEIIEYLTELLRRYKAEAKQKPKKE